MVAATTFYIDDSGTRHPDHDVKVPKHGNDWFALGGVLIDDDQIPVARALIEAFRLKWPQLGTAPLHSHEIRGCHRNFKWLGVSQETRERFLCELEGLLLALPVVGLACVIDRPGYNLRYRAKYGREQWSLCKTAFAVATERAVKFALERNRKLRVFVEKSSKSDDKVIRGYYDALKGNGHWFDAGNASKYGPLPAEDYRSTLYEFRIKDKSSSLMQIADLYLWPMCMGGYDRANFAYSRLLAGGKLIECHLAAEQIPSKGSKYSCFDRA